MYPACNNSVEKLINYLKLKNSNLLNEIKSKSNATSIKEFMIEEKKEKEINEIEREKEDREDAKLLVKEGIENLRKINELCYANQEIELQPLDLSNYYLNRSAQQNINNENTNADLSASNNKIDTSNFNLFQVSLKIKTLILLSLNSMLIRLIIKRKKLKKKRII